MEGGRFLFPYCCYQESTFDEIMQFYSETGRSYNKAGDWCSGRRFMHKIILTSFECRWKAGTTWGTTPGDENHHFLFIFKLVLDIRCQGREWG